jgi:hypothetical protein
VITNVALIAIDGNGVCINGQLLNSKERIKLAVADGFSGWPDMRAWFAAMYGREFTGLLIYWDAPIMALEEAA